MLKSFYFYFMEKLLLHQKSCWCLSLYWRNELNKEITLGYPYFSVWLKSSNAITMVFYEQPSLGIRDSLVIKLMANDWKEWISLLSSELSLIVVIFIVLSFLFCFGFFYFSSWYQFIFDWFNFWKFNFTYFSHNYHNYSMFRDVPECSMFEVLSTADRKDKLKWQEHTAYLIFS